MAVLVQNHICIFGIIYTALIKDLHILEDDLRRRGFRVKKAGG